MSFYTAKIFWSRGEQNFLDRKYSRAHHWEFDGGEIVAASASPHIVPTPMSEPANVDPEEAFVASLSSCHMLFFLDFASRQGLVVDKYSDQAEGQLQNGADGKLMMMSVVLKPRISFYRHTPSSDVIHELHHKSHEACFIANSVKTQVRVEPVLDSIGAR